MDVIGGSRAGKTQCMTARLKSLQIAEAAPLLLRAVVEFMRSCHGSVFIANDLGMRDALEASQKALAAAGVDWHELVDQL